MKFHSSLPILLVMIYYQKYRNRMVIWSYVSTCGWAILQAFIVPSDEAENSNSPPGARASPFTLQIVKRQKHLIHASLFFFLPHWLHKQINKAQAHCNNFWSEKKKLCGHVPIIKRSHLRAIYSHTSVH